MKRTRYQVGFTISIQADQQDQSISIGEAEKRKVYLQYLNKGIKLTDWRCHAGYNGDDFVHNRFSIACKANVYRIPRIVKNYLLKQLK